MMTAPMNIQILWKFYEGNAPAPQRPQFLVVTAFLHSLPSSNPKSLPIDNYVTMLSKSQQKTDRMNAIFRKAPIGSLTSVTRCDPI